MANFQSTQALYSLTLQEPSASDAAVTCNVFRAPQSADQQIFEARGERIYIQKFVKTGVTTGTLEPVAEHHTFSNVRGLCALRIPGTETDALIVVSDSGRISLLNFDPQRNAFDIVKIESFGKSGVRRGIPGQFLANDRRGRAVMIASPEKSKVVYMLQRQVNGAIQISSPHEVNQWAVFTNDICSLDTGWEHPIFAALEIDMGESDADPTGLKFEEREKRVVYYTVDLSLNHVVKSWSAKVDQSANKLFSVPGGQDGPSGVLVCSEGYIEYVHYGVKDQDRLRVEIPRRRRRIEDPARTSFIVAGCMHLLKTQNDFFFLLQTEDGDVFKLTMTMKLDAQGRRTSTPTEITLKYYETLPVARSMLILKKGFLYLTADTGNSELYFIHDLADDLEEEGHNTFSTAKDEFPWYFTPRGLFYLSHSTEIPQLHPLIKAKVDNALNEDMPQIYALQGSRNHSHFKTIRHGFSLQEFVSSRLEGVAYRRIWSLKRSLDAEFHEYLILSTERSESATCVLQISDSVEAIEDTAFIATTSTLFAHLMRGDMHVQVHPRGVRSIYPAGNFTDWNSPLNVVAASGNEGQLLVGLSSNELAFFILAEDGTLSELADRPEMSGRITAIAVGRTPLGKLNADYAVVGCDDCTIRVLSIDPEGSPLELMSIQALSSAPSSIQLIDQLDPVSDTMATYVHIGLQSGLYLRALLDENGELGEVRTKLLSAEPIRLFPVETHGQNAVIACTSRPWLGHHNPKTGQYTTTPLIAGRWASACHFYSEELQGVCAVDGEFMIIASIPRIDTRFATTATRLNYTPRALSRHPTNPIFYVAESDANTPSPETLAKTEALFNKKTRDAVADKSAFYSFPGGQDSMAGVSGNAHLGLPRFQGHWGACVQAVDASSGLVTSTHEFDNNESALTVACVQFESNNWEPMVVVSVGRNIDPSKPQSQTGALHLFSVDAPGGGILTHMHATDLDAPVHAMHPFKGKLAVGVGRELSIFDYGTKSLLRKARGTVVPNQIVSLDFVGNRFTVGDVSESITYVVFKEDFNRFVPFVDDSIKRWVSSSTMLDYEGVAGGDKYGNLWILRCPEQASRESDEESANGHLMNERSYMGGRPYRSDVIAHFYANDIPVSLQRAPLVPGGDSVIFWAGLQGTLGIMQPFVSRADLDLFVGLEQQLRVEDPSITGRDHLMYRSYYVPVKGVIDGDLCERFLQLPYDQKQRIAAEVERDVKTIEKKIQDMRTRVAY